MIGATPTKTLSEYNRPRKDSGSDDRSLGGISNSSKLNPNISSFGAPSTKQTGLNKYFAEKSSDKKSQESKSKSGTSEPRRISFKSVPGYNKKYVGRGGSS